MPVTNENKREFVQLSAQYRLYSSIKSQIEALSAGFYEIIPKDMITIVSLPFTNIYRCLIRSSFSSTSRSLSCSSLERRTLTSTNGAQLRTTSGIRRRTPTSFGGGVRSSRSTARSARRCSASRRARPESRSAASSSCRASRARNGSPSTRRTARWTACRRRTPVSLSLPSETGIVLTPVSAGFNQIDLPQYSSYEMLRQQLLLAIHEGGEGFGFA